MRTIYEEVINRRIPFATHESDLYLWVSDETIALVDSYRFKGNVTTFISETDGKLMYDIPFAYPRDELRKTNPTEKQHYGNN